MRESDVRRSRGRHARQAVNRDRRRLATYGAVAFVIILAGTLGVQRFDGASTTTAPSTTGFYLVVGASASLGFQPTGIVGHNGARTDRGYANDVLAVERARGVNLTMRQVGCPGETTFSMLHTGDHCYLGSGSQRHAAVRYLGLHHAEPGLVTIDLGFNDVRTCLWKWVPEESCVSAGLAQIRANLPGVIALLRHAAGPHVYFVGVLYADPFLSDYLNPNSSATAANETRVLVTRLDAELTQIYRAADVPVANVPGVFHMDDVTTTTWNHRTVPENVYYACAWTWLCTPPPWGPDDHPNDAGYRAIANSILLQVPPTW